MALNNLHPMAGWGWWSRVPRRLWPRCLRRLRRRYESVVDWQRNEQPQQLHWLEEGRHVNLWLPQRILGKSGKSRGPFLGNAPRVKELGMFSKCGFPVPHFFLQLDFSGDSDQNGGKRTWPATNLFFRPLSRVSSYNSDHWELPLANGL